MQNRRTAIVRQLRRQTRVWTRAPTNVQCIRRRRGSHTGSGSECWCIVVFPTPLWAMDAGPAQPIARSRDDASLWYHYRSNLFVLVCICFCCLPIKQSPRVSDHKTEAVKRHWNRTTLFTEQELNWTELEFWARLKWSYRTAGARWKWFSRSAVLAIWMIDCSSIS